MALFQALCSERSFFVYPWNWYTQCLSEFPVFLFYYDTIYRYFLDSFSDKPVVYFFFYLFIVPTTCIFCEECVPFFSNEAVNLCLFLTNVETVFRAGDNTWAHRFSGKQKPDVPKASKMAAEGLGSAVSSPVEVRGQSPRKDFIFFIWSKVKQWLLRWK